jgi:hypothetical protein
MVFLFSERSETSLTPCAAREALAKAGLLQVIPLYVVLVTILDGMRQPVESNWNLRRTRPDNASNG